MFLCVIEIENYYIFLTINFYIIGCLGEKKNQKKEKEKEKEKRNSGICFIKLIIIYYKTRDPKIC